LAGQALQAFDLMEVPTLSQFEALQEFVGQLRQEVQELKAQLPEWVDQAEASKLSGYSRSWFFHQRRAGTLPVAYKKAGPRTLFYLRADCVQLGRDNLILPPASVAA